MTTSDTKIIEMVIDGTTYAWPASIVPPVTPPPLPAPPRIAMWLQVWDFDTKAEVDTLIEWCCGKVTDLYAIAQDGNTAPRTVTGESALMHVTDNRVDGLTPMGYLIEKAATVGIKVHAWFIINPFAYWGGNNAALIIPLADNAANHNTSNSGNTIQYANPVVRQAVVDAVVDFVAQNPGLAGVNLDYIRTDGKVVQTDEDVTALVEELRARVTVEISVCALSVYNATSKHQDIVAWVNNNLIDTVAVMAYYESAGKKMHIWDQMDLTDKTLLVGVGTEERSSSRDFNVTTPSDNRATIRQYSELGYPNFALFCWSDSMKMPDRQAVIEEYLRSAIDLTAPYPDIQAVEIVPGVSISLTIGGVVHVTTFAEAAPYTTTGTLKKYIEGVQGPRPWTHYQRPTASTIRIQIGDWEI